jgi:hypothetical protein
MKLNFVKDTVSSGILLSVLLISTSTVLLLGFETFWTDFLRYTSFLNTNSRIPLIVLALNVIVFRFLIIKWKMMETAKGVLLVVFLATLLYMTNQKYLFFEF